MPEVNNVFELENLTYAVKIPEDESILNLDIVRIEMEIRDIQESLGDKGTNPKAITEALIPFLSRELQFDVSFGEAYQLMFIVRRKFEEGKKKLEERLS